MAIFLGLLRDDSFPLDSISERLGEPGRFRLLTFLASAPGFDLIPDSGPLGTLAFGSSKFFCSFSNFTSCLSGSFSSSDWTGISDYTQTAEVYTH